MGNYFVMSKRFNKREATDFGFTPIDADTAINPKDNSIWKKTSLYDFGWGKENGFYKVPLPEFDTLFELALHSTSSEDTYGAAAIILEKYPDSLLDKCEEIMMDNSQKKEFKRLTELFNLKNALNRSPISGKTLKQIQNDYARWENVSKNACGV